jgi:putative membrane protein
MTGCPGNANTNGNANVRSNTGNTIGNSIGNGVNSVSNAVGSAVNTVANATTSNGNSTGSMKSADDFMAEAAQGGMAEVELGKLAASKGASKEVKDFGSKMVADHSKANAELKALAAKKKVTLPTDVNSEQKSEKDKLSNLSGAAFDKEYVNAMVEDHEKDVADFQRQADAATDAEVKAFAAKTLPTLKSHLEMIKAIQGKMK